MITLRQSEISRSFRLGFTGRPRFRPANFQVFRTGIASRLRTAVPPGLCYSSRTTRRGINAGAVASNSDSSEDEVFEDAEQMEEAVLQEYLQKLYGKKSSAPAPNPTIRCLNCTQPAPFNGVCPRCGHAHAQDAHLTFVPLEYSRSAYVYMRQQLLAAAQNAASSLNSTDSTSSSMASAATNCITNSTVPRRISSTLLQASAAQYQAAVYADGVHMDSLINGVHPPAGVNARWEGSQQGGGPLRTQPVGPVLLAWDDRTGLHHNASQTPLDEVTGLKMRMQLHPERPERTQAIVSRLYRSGLLECCQAVPARAASEDELLAVHTRELVHGVRDLSKAAAEWNPECPDHVLDVGGDTYANRHTWDVCTMAAGMAIDVALGVASRKGSHGAAIIRPPGHHAEHNGVMGFCFLNYGAIVAKAVQRELGLKRVAIVDWDVHHGNGAQHVLWEDPSVLTVSLHRHDGGNYFPGSGACTEVGSGPGEGKCVNVPWTMPGMGDAEYLAAFDQVVLPVLREFSPELIIVAAGFDSAASDPLGGCSLSPSGFAKMTQHLKSMGPVVLLLEGGYNLTATSTCFEACLRVLLGEEPASEAQLSPPAFVALRAISNILEVQSQYWHCLQPLNMYQLMESYQWLGAGSIINRIMQDRRGKPPPAMATAAVM